MEHGTDPGSDLSPAVPGMSGYCQSRGTGNPDLPCLQKEPALCAGAALSEMRKRDIEGGSGILWRLPSPSEALYQRISTVYLYQSDPGWDTGI